MLGANQTGMGNGGSLELLWIAISSTIDRSLFVLTFGGRHIVEAW